MTLEELKDLMLKVSMGRRDAAEQVAELLHLLMAMTASNAAIASSLVSIEAQKPKKAAK
jgi:hypothetical protein